MEEFAAVRGVPENKPVRMAMAMVRGYASHDAGAVSAAVDGVGEAAHAEMCVIVDGLLRSTLAIAGIVGQGVSGDALVRLVDRVSSVAPPHFEFAVGEAVRGFALGGETKGQQVSLEDTLGTLHALAACTAALGLSLWGREVFIGLLAESVRTALELSRTTGVAGRGSSPMDSSGKV
ncbi:hypothetical protein ACFY5C_24490 [Streptomyces sp. NPDC012935]|uniref:hypothetical protein n=1 Tax=Streptomyces sp. NPDC012935 TaxID=3364857 RepID=UPI00369B514D